MKTYAHIRCGERALGLALQVACLMGAGAVLHAPSAAYADVPTQGLVGYWRGDTNAQDSSVTANHGSFGGSYVPGGPGGSAAFNLATGKVHISDNAAYDFQNFSGWTVGFWFNTNGIAMNQNNGVFLGQDHGSGFQPKWFIDYGYTVFGPTQTFVLHLNDFNTERIFIESNPGPIPAGWNQLSVVVNNVDRSVSFYLNGGSIGVRGLEPYVLRPTSDLVFGFAEPGLFYDGLLNNVAIYNRALTSSEVHDLVVNVPGPGVVALCAAGAVCALRRRRVEDPNQGARDGHR